jgi:hypothetical protein
MPNLLQYSSRFDSSRGGRTRKVTFTEFIDLTKNKDRPVFVVEGLISPDLGDSSWGGFLIREGATRVLPRFRR